jgi:hypothetical protein
MGMFDEIKGKALCPVCGIITEMEGQTKYFGCTLNTLDMYDLPWNDLNSYYKHDDCPEYVYGHWDHVDANSDRKKKWHASICVYLECTLCRVKYYGEVVYSNDTYTKRKPTNDWIFEGIIIDEVDPDTLMVSLHGKQKDEYIANYSKKGKWIKKGGR